MENWKLVFPSGSWRLNFVDAPSRPVPTADRAPDGPPPRDLEASEASVAAWFEQLPGKPPSALGSKVADAFRPTPGARPMRRWSFGLITAAALAVVVGVVLWTSNEAREVTVQEQPKPPERPAVPTAVVDDPSMPLYRNLETFRALDEGRPDADEDADEDESGDEDGR